MGGDAAANRWEQRPAIARALRLFVLVVPVIASVVAAALARFALPPASGALSTLGVLAVLIAVSGVTLYVVDKLARRLLPLVLLLELRMLFPDRAPSRLAVAREASRRRPIEEQLRRVADAGGDPCAVAGEILALVAALSRHDRPTRGHAERVRLFTDLVAEQMRIPARDRDLLRWVAILHDIGKLRVSASLLNKPGKPTAQEWIELQAHPAHGAQIAAALVPWLGQWGEVIIQHHERYDGTGYPQGLSGTQISLGARIVAVADAYDVMTAQRPYRRPVSRAAALAELVRYSGSQFDPVVVRAMVDVGAPGLRRAQGLLAVLADLPLVASKVVPVATVGRVVGAGALATGVVTAGQVVQPDAPPSRPTASVTSDSGGVDHAGGTTSGDSGISAGTGVTGPGWAASGIPSAMPGVPATQSPTADPAADPAVDPTAAPASPASPAPTVSAPGSDAGGSGGGGLVHGVTGTVKTVTGGVTGGVDKTAKGLTGAVDGTVGGTLGGTVGSTVDGVTDTVDDTVGGVTGTVDDTVDSTVNGALGGVSGALGGLLGH